MQFFHLCLNKLTLCAHSVYIHLNTIYLPELRSSEKLVPRLSKLFQEHREAEPHNWTELGTVIAPCSVWIELEYNRSLLNHTPKEPFKIRIPTISSSCTWICLWTSAIWNSTSPSHRETERHGENTWILCNTSRKLQGGRKLEKQTWNIERKREKNWAKPN